jgi:gliding motility-associated-like protein
MKPKHFLKFLAPFVLAIIPFIVQAQNIAINTIDYGAGKVTCSGMIYLSDSNSPGAIYDNVNATQIFENIIKYTSQKTTGKIAIFNDDVNNGIATRLKNFVISKGWTVDGFNSSTALNTVAGLSAYDLVIIGCDGNGNTIHLSDATFNTSLQTYVNNGGGLFVTGWIAWKADQAPNFKNMLQTISPYSVLGSYSFYNNSYNLVLAQPSHPILNNVSFLSYNGGEWGTYHTSYTLRSGATTVANFTTYSAINVSSNAPICTGATLNLTANGGVSYAWTGPNSFSSSLQNPSISNATSANAGTYTCVVTKSDASTVSININVVVDATPTVANAGTDQSLPISVTSATMAANTPSVGTGTWTKVSGPGSPVITTPSSPTTTITNLGPGTHVFRWTIANGACNASTDDVTIDINNNPYFTSTPVLTATVGSVYTYAVAAVNPTNNPITLAANTALPSWLSLQASSGGNGQQIGTSLPFSPGGASSDANGNFYVVENIGLRIYKITPNGTTAAWATKPGGGATNTYGGCLVVGNYLYISTYSCGSGQVYRYDITAANPDASVTTIYNGVDLMNLAYRNGFLYGANYCGGKIVKIDLSNNTATDYLTGLPNSGPFGVGFTPSGDMLIPTWSNGTLLKYNGSTVSTVLSGLSNVSDVKVDADGNVYISFYSSPIRKYNSSLTSFVNVSGAVNFVWGMSLSASGVLAYPDASGNAVYRLQTGATVTGTPAISDIGTHPISLKVTDNTTSAEATQNYTLTVYGPSTFTVSNLTKGSNQAPFTLVDPSSNSTGAFNYSSSNTGVATVSGNTITLAGTPGTTTITVTQAAAGLYTQTTKTFVLTVLGLPTITSVSPSPVIEGQTLTISGTNFTGATLVSIGGVSVPFTVVSSTSITVNLPLGLTSGKLTVTTPGGTASGPAVQIASNTTANCYTGWSGGWQKITTTNTGYLNTVTLKLSNSDTNNDYELYLELYDADADPSSANPWSKFANPIESSATVTMSRNTAAGEVIFTFPGNVLLAANTNYYVAIKEVAGNPAGTGLQGIYLDCAGTDGGAGNNFGTLYYKFSVSPMLVVQNKPTITTITKQMLILNTPSDDLMFSIADTETPANSLTVTAISSNTTLVPNANVVFTGTGTNRTVKITPAVGQTGLTNITLTVTDASGLTASTNFLVMVNGPSDALVVSGGTCLGGSPLTASLKPDFAANTAPWSGAGLGTSGFYGTLRLAQTFLQKSTLPINTISVLLNRAGNSSDFPIKVYIKDTDTNGYPGANTLAEASIANLSATNFGQNTYTFELATPVQLIANKKYALVFEALTGSITASPSGGDAYADGSQFESNDMVTWVPSSYTANDVIFNTNYIPGANEFTWYRNGTLIAGENGSSYTPSAAGSYTATITPIGLPSSTLSSALVVNPIPTVNQPDNITFQNGMATTAVIFTGAVSGTTYTWTNSNTSFGLPANGSGDIASFTPNFTGNTSQQQVTATITVTPSANGCVGVAKTFTITVNLNAPPTNITLTPSAIDENNVAGSTVGTLSTTDIDAGDTHTYTLVSGIGSTDNALFTIVGNQLNASTSFDFETKSSYSVLIRTTDAGGLSVNKIFIISINNVNETPQNISLSTTTIYENNAAGSIVGILSTTDQDAGDTHTYTLVGGDLSVFTLTGNQLKTVTSLKYSSQNSYTVRIRSTDAGNLSFEKTFIITILPAPVVTGTGNNPGSQQQTPPSANPSISKGYSSQLNVSGSGIVSYSWSPSTGLSATNIANPIATPSQTTTYTVTVTHSSGAVYTQNITVVVNDDYNVTPQNILTPNGDGQNDTWVIENLSSYPVNKVSIFDAAGRMIYVKNGYTNDWSGSNLIDGTYYYIIEFGTGVTPKRGFITIIR